MRNYFAKFFQREKEEEEIKKEECKPDIEKFREYANQKEGNQPLPGWETDKCPSIVHPKSLTSELPINLKPGDYVPIVHTITPAEISSIITDIPKIDKDLEKKVRNTYTQAQYAKDYAELKNWIQNTWKEDYLLIGDIQKNLWPKKNYYAIRYHLRNLKRDGYFIKNEGKILRLSKGKLKKVIWILDRDRNKFIKKELDKIAGYDPQELKNIAAEVENWRAVRRGNRRLPMNDDIWQKIELLVKDYSYHILIKELQLRGRSKGRLKKLYREEDTKEKDKKSDVIIDLYNHGMKQIDIAKKVGRSNAYISMYLKDIKRNRKKIREAEIRAELTNNIKEHVTSVMEKPKQIPVLLSEGSLEITKPDGTKITIQGLDNPNLPKLLKEYLK